MLVWRDILQIYKTLTPVSALNRNHHIFSQTLIFLFYIRQTIKINSNSRSMKKIIPLFFFVCFIKSAVAQPNAMIQASGSHLIGVCGDTIILRGINYEPFNWGYNINDEKFSELMMTGANCVRIPWYTSSAAAGGAPLFDQLSNLDTAIARCIRNKMIAIVDLHDNTCIGDISQIATLSNWWLTPNVITMINKYKRSIIINIANEAGYVQWSGNAATALVDFKNTYQGIVANFRNSGIDVPLMIDAPDCGTNLDDLASIAQNLQINDPKHNLIFSAHAYWYAYANNDSLIMRNKIINALSKNVPIVLGEIANLQDDASPCVYVLNYTALLHICSEFNVPWLAWSWDHDNCPARQISSSGYYANLTAFGNDIVHHAGYGLLSTSTITNYLAHNQICTTGIAESFSEHEIFEISNTQNGTTIKSLMNEEVNITLYDMTSRKIISFVLNNNARILQLPIQNHGLYFVTGISNHLSSTRKVIL